MIIPIASAFYEGQVLSQEELNNITINTENFNCGYHTGTMQWEYKYNTPLRLKVANSCLRLTRYYENHYIVKNDEGNSYYSLKKIIDCMSQHTGAYCLNEVSQSLITQLDDEETRFKRRAWYMQEREAPYTINEQMFEIPWK